MLKYEFTGETKGANRRIRRISDGLKGGWIESELNLSQEGDCFVYDEAAVTGDAHVSGNATIKERACVRSGAIVCGNAVISGKAWVSGDCHIGGYAIVSTLGETGP